MSSQALLDSLERHNAKFEALLSLIPPKHYIVNDDPDFVRLFHSIRFASECSTRSDRQSSLQAQNRYLQNKKGKAPKQEIKDKTKKAKQAKVLASSPLACRMFWLMNNCNKLDPSNLQSLPDILAARPPTKEPTSTSSKKRPAPADDSEDNEDDGDDDIMLDSSTNLDDAQPLPEPVSITHLQKRLADKISAMQTARFRTGANASSLGTSAESGVREKKEKGKEPGSREELLEEGRRRRGEMRDERRRKVKEIKKGEREKGAKKVAGKEKSLGTGKVKCHLTEVDQS